MKRILLVLIGAAALTTARATPVSPPVDSIGVEKKDGKLFILHRISEGQTLFSLVRRYKTSLQAIREANPGLSDKVRYDQVVRVPVTTLPRRDEKAIEKALKKEEREARRDERDIEKADKREEKAIQKDNRRAEVSSDLKEKQLERLERRENAAVKKADLANANSGIHQVEAGQTLFSLANRYGVSMEDLRRWNNLRSDKVGVGQPLLVSEKAWRDRTPTAKTPLTRSATAKVESTQVELPRATPRPEPAKPASTTGKATRKPAEVPAPADRPRSPEPEASAEPRVIRPGDSAPLPAAGANARRISEIGIAELIDEKDHSNKYLALHRTAPIGTLVLVRNDMNNQSIWVKVIGRLPDTSINSRVVIKISARAFEKLSPADRRFRAEVSYLLQ